MDSHHRTDDVFSIKLRDSAKDCKRSRTTANDILSPLLQCFHSTEQFLLTYLRKF